MLCKLLTKVSFTEILKTSLCFDFGNIALDTYSTNLWRSDNPDCMFLSYESTLYSCLNVTEFLAQSRREIWSLSDCNWTRTQNHLVHKRTLNHLAKWFVYEQMVRLLSVRLWTKWLWVRAQLQSDNPVKDIRFKKVYMTIGQNENHATWMSDFLYHAGSLSIFTNSC